jgi:hypothetical protein
MKALEGRQAGTTLQSVSSHRAFAAARKTDQMR